jgi:predicted lipid-binding transport protein (Tim44 family)
MDNLGFGLGVTAVGFGIVLGLLGLLWLLLSVALRFDRPAPTSDAAPDAASPLSVNVSSALDPAFAAAPVPASPAAGAIAAPASPEAADLDPRLVAAIAVAVMRHSETRRQQAAAVMRSYTPGSLLFASRWVAAGRMRQAQPFGRRGG